MSFSYHSLQASEFIWKETLPLGNICPTQFKTPASTLKTLLFKSKTHDSLHRRGRLGCTVWAGFCLVGWLGFFVLLILSEGLARDLMLKIEIKAQDEMVTPPKDLVVLAFSGMMLSTWARADLSHLNLKGSPHPSCCHVKMLKGIHRENSCADVLCFPDVVSLCPENSAIIGNEVEQRNISMKCSGKASQKLFFIISLF